MGKNICNDLFEGLKAVVQYRRKDDGTSWITMSAFDHEGVAKRYAESCSSDDSPWEYQAVTIENKS